ncbi:NAD(P)H-binding protein [Paenibacillus agaridevorans]|uniref:NmrA family NAD(P)-binding protein n=1 Tax=Paenibacillus agaridevorans TaxID=171404 RepID=UPI001BE4B9AD|nr:NAD(P)H-binding protein [Paenibacillus agaridevorans]
MIVNQNEVSDQPVLIIGGTGKTGRRVAERLKSQGVEVRVASRTGAAYFDWTDQSTWGKVLEGVSAAYVAYYPDLAVPGAAEDIAAFSRVAISMGVRKIVLLSGRGEEGALMAERELRNSGADWTIVRASWFNQNFNEGILVDAVRSGIIALPAGDVTEPFLDVDDIADVAVEALTDDRHIGQIYELTGPDLLTFVEVADIIATTSGRDVQFVRISTEDFVAGLRHEGYPKDFIDLLVDLFTRVLDGRNSTITDGVKRALGREPRPFRAFARDAAAAGQWLAVNVNE